MPSWCDANRGRGQVRERMLDHRTALRPQITQMYTDDIAPSQFNAERQRRKGAETSQLRVGDAGIERCLISRRRDSDRKVSEGGPRPTLRAAPCDGSMVRWLKTAMAFAMVFAFFAVFAVKLRCAMALRPLRLSGSTLRCLQNLKNTGITAMAMIQVRINSGTPALTKSR